MSRIIRLELSKPQLEIFNAPSRHRVAVCGRRFGKTFGGGVDCARAGLQASDQNVFWIFPTYKMGKQIAWGYLKDLLRPWHPKINETDLNIFLPNGSVVGIRGADKPDSLRGMGLNFAALDEYADMKPTAWSVVRPALADRRGRALFIGTPKGHNHFYDVYMNALESMEAGSDQWSAFMYTTLQGGRVSPEEIEAAKSELDEKTFRQEFYATFEELAGMVYYNFDRQDSVGKVEDNGGPLMIGIDFNVNPMSAIVGQRAGDRLHILDEVIIPNSNTREMAHELKRRYGAEIEEPTLVKADTPGHLDAGVLRLRREMAAYPDPSGRNRSTSAGGDTDFTILRDEGFVVRSPNAAPRVSDRVNEVNAMLKNVDGVRRLIIHPRCQILIRCLAGQTYKPGTSEPDKSLEAEMPRVGRMGLDHPIDALGYAVHFEFPITQKVLKARKVRI